MKTEQECLDYLAKINTPQLSEKIKLFVKVNLHYKIFGKLSKYEEW